MIKISSKIVKGGFFVGGMIVTIIATAMFGAILHKDEIPQYGNTTEQV